MKKHSRILCFDENTTVETEKGTSNIKSIVPGTIITAYDIETGSLVKDVVTKTAQSLHALSALIIFEDGTSLNSTVDHPLYVQDKGWCAVRIDGLKEMYGVGVKQLEEGDYCLAVKVGKVVPLKVLSIKVDSCSETFYCLSTERFKDFIANGIVSHDVDISRFSKEVLSQEGVIVAGLE